MNNEVSRDHSSETERAILLSKMSSQLSELSKLANSSPSLEDIARVNHVLGKAIGELEWEYHLRSANEGDIDIRDNSDENYGEDDQHTASKW